MEQLVVKLDSIKELINKRMMLVHTENFHVSCLAELWDLYDNEAKHNFCQNILHFSLSFVTFLSGASKKSNTTQTATFRPVRIWLFLLF